MSPRGRRILWGLGGVLTLAVGLGVLWQQGVLRRTFKRKGNVDEPVRGVWQVGRVEIRREGMPPERLGNLPAASVPSFLDSVRRVIPDRRALYAVAEIRRMLKGRSDRNVLVKFENGHWTVRVGAEDVGQLPEIPSFSDLLRLVRSWADRERKTTPVVSAEQDAARFEGITRTLESAPAPDVLGSLRSLEDDWRRSPGDPGVARIACRALLWIHLQTADDLQLSDPILGKALALLALLPGDNSRETMLVASQMGYESAALDAALHLSSDDPDRLFVERRDEELARITASAPNPRSEYLYLLRLAARGDGDRLATALLNTSWDGRAGAPVLSLLVREDVFGTSEGAAELLKAQLFAEVFSGKFPHARSGPPTIAERFFFQGIPDGLPEGHLKSFEKRLSRQANGFKGQLLDPETIKAYYLSGVYTGIHTTAQFLFDRLSSTAGARTYAARFVDPPPGTARDLHRWISSRLAFREGAPTGLSDVQDDLSELRHIGMIPLERTVFSLRWANRHDWGTLNRKPMRGLLDGLDSRPSNLWLAGVACWEHLRDLKRAEPYVKTAAETSPLLGYRNMPWFLGLAGDMEGLRALGKGRNLPSPVRASALKSLAELHGTDAAEIEAMYLALAKDEWTGTEGIEGYVDLVLQRGDSTAALQAVADWIDRRNEKQDIWWAHGQTLRASILRRAGRLQEARDSNDLALGSGTAGSIAEGVEILMALGEVDEAVQLARQGIERYPEGGHFPALLAECFWKQGDVIGAARELRAARPRMSQDEWNTVVAKQFASSLATHDPTLADRAFDAFLPIIREDYDLDYVVDEIEKAGNPTLAARLLSKIGENDIIRMVRIFQLREKSEGREAALAWLRPKMPKISPQFPLYILARGEDELLWDLYNGVPNAGKAEILQLMRAAALARSRRFDDPRVRDVLAFFADSKVRVLARAMGQHLLAGGDPSLVWSVALNDEQRAIAAWALGVRAESDGELGAANDWYQVTSELGEPNNPTKWFSFFAVERWKDQKRLFSRIATEARQH